MALLALLLLSQAAASPCIASPAPVEPPSLIVQAVDSNWLPLPGMQVTIIPSRGTKCIAQTKRDGFAELWLPRNAEYSIEVESPGFKRKRVKSVKIGPVLEYTSTAYVQVQLEVASPKMTIE